MRFLPSLALSFFSLTAASLDGGQGFLRVASESNVNQRYRIENVSVMGVAVEQLPAGLRRRIHSLPGEPCDPALLDEVSADIRKQLHVRAVAHHLTRGTEPDRVNVSFELIRRDAAFDVSLPRFLYHSKQGFTGEAVASTRLRGNNLAFGLTSNGEDLTERYTGMTAAYERVWNKTRLQLNFEDFHEQWNQRTVEAARSTGLDLYRSRWSVAPRATFAVARPISMTLGADFQQMDSESQAVGARSARALTFDARYGHKIEGTLLHGTELQQQLEGHYSLRVATRALGSTYSYARHMISFRYESRWGRHSASDEFTAGSIAGMAPSFEHFVLGSSSTLRGWDRYEIDPLGGSRVVHNEMRYGYKTGEGTTEAFYDAGALWESSRQAKLRHSLGVGYKRGIFVLSMAIPIRQGHVEPVFMAGMNY